MTAQSKRTRQVLVLGCALTTAGIAYGIVSLLQGTARVAWVSLALAATLVAANLMIPDETRAQALEPLDRVRASSRAESASFLRDPYNLNTVINHEQVKQTRNGRDLVASLSEFRQGFLAWGFAGTTVVSGPPGTGKTVLMHQLADALNHASTGVCAVVLPLVTYRWESKTLEDWIAKEIAALAGISEREIIQLLQQG